MGQIVRHLIFTISQEGSSKSSHIRVYQFKYKKPIGGTVGQRSSFSITRYWGDKITKRLSHQIISLYHCNITQIKYVAHPHICSMLDSFKNTHVTCYLKMSLLMSRRKRLEFCK